MCTWVPVPHGLERWQDATVAKDASLIPKSNAALKHALKHTWAVTGANKHMDPKTLCPSARGKNELSEDLKEYTDRELGPKFRYFGKDFVQWVQVLLYVLSHSNPISYLANFSFFHSNFIGPHLH